MRRDDEGKHERKFGIASINVIRLIEGEGLSRWSRKVEARFASASMDEQYTDNAKNMLQCKNVQ